MNFLSGSYEEAIHEAGTSLRQYINVLNEDEDAGNICFKASKQRTKRNLEKIAITLDDVDKLNIIHVTGTKGKGSTCFYCESILRHCGYKTGLYISPHVVETRERIRIDGVPITKEKFSKTFYYIYNVLQRENTQEEMPTGKEMYFLMALKIFIEEKIDVMILEVGIGGEYDSTNVIQNPLVCGITSIGVDHTNILGETLQEIAWHKGGIIKEGAIAITCSQKQEVLAVLHLRAIEKGVVLNVAPALDEFEQNQSQIELGINGLGSRINAALALQLCDAWMQQIDTIDKKQNSKKGLNKAIWEDAPAILKGFHLTDQIRTGLKKCHRLGVCQTVQKSEITYYLDCAHTIESMQLCVNWFKQSSTQECEQKRVKTTKILMFFTKRNPVNLLPLLVECNFDIVIFPGYKVNTENEKLPDFYDTLPKIFVDVWRNLSEGKEVLPFNTYREKVSTNKIFSEECQKFLITNRILQTESKTDETKEFKSQEMESRNENTASSVQVGYTKEFEEKSDNKHPYKEAKETKNLKPGKFSTIIKEFDTIQTSMMWIKHQFIERTTSDVDGVQVLVTGSNGIVGQVLFLLEQPDKTI